MNRFASFVIGAGMFIVFTYFWFFEYVLLAGFAEIILDASLIGSYAENGMYIVYALAFATSVVLYFFVIVRLFGATPGECASRRRPVFNNNRRPIYAYAAIIICIIASYVIAYAGSDAVFRLMVEKQRKSMEATGVSFDWKSYYPKMQYDDPENAAVLVKKIRKPYVKGSDKLYMLRDNILGDNEFELPAISKEIEKHLSENRSFLNDMDSALMLKKFYWSDVQKLKDTDRDKLELPQFAIYRDYLSLSALEAVSAANKGDWKPADKYFERTAGVIRLLRQDPTLVSTLMQISFESTAMDVLAVLTRISANNPRAGGKGSRVEFVKYTTEMLPSFNGVIAKNACFEFALFGWPLKEYVLDLKNELPKADFNAKILGIFEYPRFFTLLYFDIWGEYNRLLDLRNLEIQLRGLKEEDALKRKEYEIEMQKFEKNNRKLASISSVLGFENMFPYKNKETALEAKKKAVLLFAAVLDYKRKNGRYPVNLKDIAPRFLTDVPLNPVDGRDFIYRATGDFMEINGANFGDKALIKTAYAGVRPK